MSKENLCEIVQHAGRVERQISALELFRLFLRSEVALPEALIDIHDQIQEALEELYDVRREIRGEIGEISATPEGKRPRCRIVSITGGSAEDGENHCQE